MSTTPITGAVPQRTQVAIIGAGPAGLLLGQLLHTAGIDAVIVEQRSRDYVLGRIRAGVLEQGTVGLLERVGCAGRLHREGLVHDGLMMTFGGRAHRIDIKQLTGGKNVTVFGQTEVTRDLVEMREQQALPLLFEATNVTPHDFDAAKPWISFDYRGRSQRLNCEFIAGCDGFHGISRASVPPSALRTYERSYPFGWLGLLADVPPVDEELVYARGEEGFALCSMRSPTRSRYYIQCRHDERVEAWSDARFWDALRRVLPAEIGERVVTAPSLEMSVAPLRSFVAEPLRFGRLFLCGDAAHIVPPTGAKGLNLAASDAYYLFEALAEWFAEGADAGLANYSQRALSRVWRTVRFSWWMTSLLHEFADASDFERRLQAAEFEHLASSERASAALAESYIGLPL